MAWIEFKKATLRLWLKYRIHRAKRNADLCQKRWLYFRVELGRKRNFYEHIPGHLRRNEVRYIQRFKDSCVKLSKLQKRLRSE